MASETIRLKRKAKGERPYFFADPDVDKLLTMLMGLAGEVSVMRDRLDTVERVAAAKGLFSAVDIEAYQPDEDALVERAARRDALLNEITRIVQAEVEGLDGESGSYTAAVDLVEND